MRAIVTGAAGFIGSTLVDLLLSRGHEVVGLDCFDDFYDEARKRENLAGASTHPAFRLVAEDLRTVALDPLLDGIDVVFHLAAQAGVRGSWSDGFERYLSQNVGASQRLLEACRGRDGLRRVVYASSSSVYGNAERYPTEETDVPAPHSPYGVTKLGAEHLCQVYAANLGVPTVSLRYFTVYGPRQRPDMAIHRLVEAARHGWPFPLLGDGRQAREFTFVGDVAEATLAAAERALPAGTVVNVSGGTPVELRQVIQLVSETVGRPIELERCPAAAGDVQRTGGATDRARSLLDWTPVVGLPEGVAAQVDWHLGAISTSSPPAAGG